MYIHFEWASSCSHWFIWNACVLLHIYMWQDTTFIKNNYYNSAHILNKNEITELQNNNNDMTTLAHTQNACKINNGMSF